MILVSILALMAACLVHAETIDPEADGSRSAWSENTGWINAKPRGDGGPGMHNAEDWGRGWLWSENVGWVSLSCANTASCATVAYGIGPDSPASSGIEVAARRPRS